MTAPWRVLVVEDELKTAAAISAILASTGAFTIEVAGTGAEAESLLETFAPDLVLMDLGLPDQDGVELIRRARAASFTQPTLVLTSATRDDRILAALRAGANGYLFKDELDARLAGALPEIMSGGAPLSAGALAAVLREVRRGTGDEAFRIAPALTPKEREVLEALSSGGGYREVAQDLHIELNTVRTHVRSLYEKLGVQNRAEAVNLGWSLGLLRRPA